MPSSSTTAETLNQFYDALLSAYGPQHWWPGDSPTEIIIGAILTQNTNWTNVAKAIERLRAADCVNWHALRSVSQDDLAEMIRPAGYYNLKARRLKNFVEWLWQEHAGDLSRLAQRPVDELRETLLGINGIGRETADSIILYALGLPTFVVDAYTARVLRRHRLIDGDSDYESIKSLIEDAQPTDVARFNEYHALLVAVGKRHCRPRPNCAGCPLERFEHEMPTADGRTD